MRFVAFVHHGERGLAVQTPAGLRGRLQRDAVHPVELERLVEAGVDALRSAADALATGPELPSEHTVLPPLPRPGKIICIGLNYVDHTTETALEQPEHPTIFLRYPSSLVGHGQPIVRPQCSEQLDFEGEMVAVIGKGGRHISRARALEHVIGWSIFNEATIRDIQFRTSQWTLGKNFDATGAFGPMFVTADEAPAGGRGLRIETRLNGAVVQAGSTNDMIFDVASIIAAVSEVMTLAPGDIIVSGTPAGCGMWRKPQLWMRPGDVVEVEVEGLGTLRNPVVQEANFELAG